MSGLIKTLFELLVIALSIAAGIMVSDNANKIFNSMDGILTYLGITSSVSFAILAVLIQFFDRKTHEEEKKYSSLKEIAVNIFNNMKVECFRIVFMILPILCYTIFSFCNATTSFHAGYLASVTFFAIAVSVSLPFRYMNFMRSYVISTVEEINNQKRKKLIRNIDENLEAYNNKSK